MSTAKSVGSGEPVFEFGKNWRRFLDVVDDERIGQAVRSLSEMLESDDLKGRTFLDAGSGSGLFSLAARKLGATVHSFDVDEESVACTRELRERYLRDDAGWRVEKGSILDQAYLETLGRFDVVYSWGVLHHTGAMWQALENVERMVRSNGLLFIAIYNDQGGPTRRWAHVKRMYVRLPRPARFLVSVPVFLRLWLPTFVRDTFLGNPLRTWRAYKTDRGMSPWRDVIDWVGGYPFEASKPEKIFDFFRIRGYTLRRLVTSGGTGCNEFVFSKDQGNLPSADTRP